MRWMWPELVLAAGIVPVWINALGRENVFFTLLILSTKPEMESVNLLRNEVCSAHCTREGSGVTMTYASGESSPVIDV